MNDPEKRSQQADRLIRDYAFGSSLTGFIPVPLVDTLSLIGVQRYMLFRLSRLYKVPFKKNIAKIALTTMTSGLTASAARPMVGSMLKLIPGVGSVLGGASMAVLGSAATYAVGKVFQQHFENGGTLEDFDPQQARQQFETELEKGKEIAKKEKAQRN
ncbi:YcjF family protein [Thiothrix nivea]|uniref:GTPase n=1 Tax=Thiothrix nivea (strain ATCC 35100 / DSM 5205 / JP2) TaxID=870187 RepID=A0A656HN69_THINJ|nr:DUF697 domain-containing protein [Thiothrix nivea]EIJ36789.1 hypothetical protein Thini_4307 [Thiothrix nivea DSM 5205]